MKAILSITLTGLLVILFSCQAQIHHKLIPSDGELATYRIQTIRTDPGEFSFMFRNLPHDFDSLNSLIKKQLIHPLEAAQNSDDALKLSKDGSTLTVESILDQLYTMDSLGLYYERNFEDRLVVACYHHAILLASILRHQGVPTRLRAGYSRYFEERMDIRFSHVVCEAWSEKEQRWIMLDADRELVDMDEDDFDLAGKAWINLKEGRYKPEKYLASISTGLKGCIFLLELDASFLIGNEKMYWDLPLISTGEIGDYEDINSDMREQLDELARLTLLPDQNTDSIQQLYEQLPYFRSAGLSYNDYIELILKSE